MKIQRRVLTTCAVGYALAFLLWRLLVASPLYLRWWPLQLSEVFGMWAYAPLPFLLLAGTRWRSRWVGVSLLVPLLWFGYEYGGLFMPEMSARAKASVAGTSLRVMTFNTWKQDDAAGDFAAALKRAQPDLIALQEVGPVFLRDLDGLSAEWPYQVEASIRVLTRVAFLSKYPILSYEADDAWRGCHCVQLMVDWHGKVVRVIVVHIRAPNLGYVNLRGQPLRLRLFDTSEQARSYAALLQYIDASREPVIVLGDFNTTERQAGYDWLYAAGLRDVHAEAGWGLGLTYPAPFTRLKWLPFPVIRIDHVFYDSAWRAMQTWTTPLMGSDHQALVADLQWVGD